MKRYLCIHGHYYQPPRENPWLEEVELEDSAAPFHDWNERIAAECYSQNAASRILDAEGRIVGIVNNYARQSFDFGPTLLRWLDARAPDVYEAVLRADDESRKRFSGHGNAIVQPYHHIIMPLANDRDKRTQMIWGVKDFERRFGRAPEGVWLPETAVDLKTLEVAADHGLKFTILAQHQARRFRGPDANVWREVDGEPIDPKRVYRLALPSGRSIAIFFYDDLISRAVAFERLLNRAENFVSRLTGAFASGRTDPQLVNIATDGETYGHHHRFGDMALSAAFDQIDRTPEIQLTNYGEYLEKNPPTSEVEFIECTSWSCVHGVGRWREDCGCETGANPGWNQKWRGPLRDAFDWLRDKLGEPYETEAKRLLKDAWGARDDYVELIDHRDDASVDAFLSRWSREELCETDRIRALQLLELQRHLMLIYTSCGWFFDDMGGLEPVQLMRYAARAIQLAEALFDIRIEEEFCNRLARGHSNDPALGNGRRIYETRAVPARVDLSRVAAHFVLASLFDSLGDVPKVYCFSVDLVEAKPRSLGKRRLATGRIRVQSIITGESDEMTFAAFYLGDHALQAGIRKFRGEPAFQIMTGEITEAFEIGDSPGLIRAFDRHFHNSVYALGTLFRDMQRHVLGRLVGLTLQEAREDLEKIYSRNVPLIRYFAELGIPQPRPLLLASEFVIHQKLMDAFTEEPLSLDTIESLLEEASRGNIRLDTEALGHQAHLRASYLAKRLREHWDDLAIVTELTECVRLAREISAGVDLSRPQNVYFEVIQREKAAMAERSKSGDARASEWLERMEGLGRALDIQIRESGVRDATELGRPL